jgi:hypothetical protein
MNPRRHFEEGHEKFAESMNAVSTTAHAIRNELATINIRKMLVTFAITLLGLAAFSSAIVSSSKLN